MKIKKMMQSLFCGLFIPFTLLSQDIVGFWTTINEETHKRESVVAIYEYKNKYYGRLIVTFDDHGGFYDSIENPKIRAPGVKGKPFYSGLDFMWDLEKEGDKYVYGVILDPEKGDEYAAESWINDKGELVVRGQILMFGKNQIWPKATDNDFPPGFKKPDLKTLVPKIPEVIE